jgi:hypothetical protein
MRERAEALDEQFQIESVLEKRYPAQGGNTGLMSALMEVEQDIQVVGTAGDGRQAVRRNRGWTTRRLKLTGSPARRLRRVLRFMNSTA